MTQAALGAAVTIPTLDGDAELEFSPGTQPGELRILRGRGMPVLQGFGRGDHRVLVNVVVPRHLSDEQRRLLEDFDAHADERTYKPDEGFFEKLKSAFR
jgi:molecular chaperone DnaJ